MMKTTLLSTVAALALATGLGTASAQTPQNTEKGGASGMERNAPAGGMERGAPPERNPSATEQAPSKKSGSPTQAQTPAQDKSNTNAQSPSKSTVGAAPSSETKLTVEQRTQLREKVIPTGPKVSNINFSLNVGTVVPRTVLVAEVPPVIIDIHPEWRGYRYFVVNDRIIIVERETLRIVAVLDV